MTRKPKLTRQEIEYLNLPPEEKRFRSKFKLFNSFYANDTLDTKLRDLSDWEDSDFDTFENGILQDQWLWHLMHAENWFSQIIYWFYDEIDKRGVEFEADYKKVRENFYITVNLDEDNELYIGYIDENLTFEETKKPIGPTRLSNRLPKTLKVVSAAMAPFSEREEYKELLSTLDKEYINLITLHNWAKYCIECLVPPKIMREIERQPYFNQFSRFITGLKRD
ncbi:hypothetical protein [Psittacicella hinzii]|uniref:Uncharacterized protein n=1 Tax=Psittacicella hinzii TaxID=2028575 RepID=A0A3A1YH57_9GAMM|nr:hypothetical protein [Psittacicella hinzii]RIY37482.1 hypothetical protein CKF58_05000 [Psittacicella hinzii]